MVEIYKTGDWTELLGRPQGYVRSADSFLVFIGYDAAGMPVDERYRKAWSAAKCHPDKFAAWLTYARIQGDIIE